MYHSLPFIEVVAEDRRRSLNAEADTRRLIRLARRARRVADRVAD